MGAGGGAQRQVGRKATGGFINIAVRSLAPLAVCCALFTLFSCAGREAARAPSPQAAAPPSVKTAVYRKPPAAPRPGSTQPLFRIERNTNANIVRYEARLLPGGGLDPAGPVAAYWEMLAGDGGRKKLNWLEKKKAYGVKTLPAPDGNGYILTLAAAPRLNLAVKLSDGKARVEKEIAGRPAVLERLFIQSKAGLLGPKVKFIDLYGKDLESGKPLQERITP